MVNLSFEIYIENFKCQLYLYFLLSILFNKKKFGVNNKNIFFFLVEIIFFFFVYLVQCVGDEKNVKIILK